MEQKKFVQTVSKAQNLLKGEKNIGPCSATEHFDSGDYVPAAQNKVSQQDAGDSEMEGEEYCAKVIGEDSSLEVWRIYHENLDALHGPEITRQEFAQMLRSSWRETDERNFLIYLKDNPVGWLKINGLDNEDISWISMLVIAKSWQHKGAGTFAVGFSEAYIRAAGKNRVGIHTTDDNLPAQKLYTKCGYTVTGREKQIDGKGESRMSDTFEKVLE